ncbi:MAG: shikimate kinase [Eubacteriales bacterium]|jgi:shikimate kinase|nr:shikimate kinase [Eubacteriales bacterium]MDD3571707.1 shikimate kinase [Eubacteriales bacterium]MDD4135024.1 shikimate kinase [Eubacteriales bacterium]NLO12846.1 shikimate kinase [Clostridiales bacterium]
MLPMHVFLVGMSASGKTSLGRRVASNLGLRFIDTDQRVEEMLGMSIGQIYASLGEDFYHNAETGVLIELVGGAPCIVSTGSGLPMIKENVQLMQNHGVIIHVDRPLDQILAEIRTERNSGLNGKTHEDVIYEFNHHIGFYRACADYTLDNSHGLQVGLGNLTKLVEGLK